MITVSDKKLCSCCFAEITSEPCSECGFSSVRYVADPAVLPCGSMLQKRYIVGRVIGKGGFGITYLAYDTKLERKVAIKEFYPYGLATRNIGDTVVIVSNEETAEAFRKGAEKFYNEARLIARFNGNPGIVGVHDFFYENATVYFTMEYLSGQTLRNYIAGHGVLSEEQAVFLAEKVSVALMTVHSANVLHRDISPDNIMLCADGSIKLIDFGAARHVVANCSHDLSVILKPGFAPLEQYQRKGKQGPWTDIYSLGATLYFALTADTPDDPMTRLENDEKISENTENAEKIDPKLWEIIHKAVMLKSADRYQNVFELRNDLSGLSLTAMPIIEPIEQQDTAIPFGVTAQPYTATARRTTNTAAPEDNRTVPLTDPSVTVPLKDASVTVPLTDPSITVPLTDDPFTVPLTSSVTSAPSSPVNKPKGHKKLVYGAGIAAILLVGVFSGILLSKTNDTDIETETTQSETTQSETSESSDNASIDSQEEETKQDNDVTQETSVITEEAELPVTAPKETEPKVTEPPVTTPKVTEPKVTQPPVTAPKVTEPKVTQPPVTTPKVTEPKVTEPPVTAPKVTEPKVTQPPVTAPKVTEPKVTQPPVTAPKVTEPAVPAVPDKISIGGKSYKTSMTGTLDLSGKNLKNSDIADLKYMTDLSEIILSNNMLTDLSALSGLTKLEKLTFHNNHVSNLSFTANMKSLKNIGAENNGITSVSDLSQLTKLEELWFAGNGIKDISPLENCVNMKKLSLTNNPIGDISALYGMKKLTEVQLGNCDIDNINALSNCKMLEIVYVYDNNITDLTPLASCKKLAQLYAFNNRLNGDLDALKGLTILEYLEIGNNGYSGFNKMNEFFSTEIYTDDDGFQYVYSY